MGDIYLGKKILAGDVFGERPESGGWNVSALDEETDAFETRKYVSFMPAADGKTSIAQYPDGRCDLFCDGYRIKAGSAGRISETAGERRQRFAVCRRRRVEKGLRRL